MQQKLVIIASILKPINDTRMYEKLGISIDKLNGFQVKIVGFKGKIPQHPSISFYPLFDFKRLSYLKRISAPVKFYQFLKRNRPDVVIVETHELLWPSYIYSIFSKCHLIYDIRENYKLNLLKGGGFKRFIRPVLGQYVRLKERITSNGINYFFLAEQVYSTQMSFIKNRWSYIPNAAVEKARNDVEKIKYRLLFSGTIAKETGVFEAIELASILHEVDSRYHLIIIGYCPQKSVLIELEKATKEKDYIEIRGGNEMVDHPAIVHCIEEASYGIISYHMLPQFSGKIPTKVFEYLSYGLTPIVIGNEEIRSMVQDNAYFIPIVNKELVSSLFDQTISSSKMSLSLHWSDYEPDLHELLKRF